VRPITLADRGAWQGNGNSFDFAAAVGTHADGSVPEDATIPLIAGDSFEQADRIVGRLGTPLGVQCYRPYHAVGEDFLHSYLGMLGIPVDLRPEFPSEAPLVLLTESASYDPRIVEKIKNQLMAGKTVVITSGLLAALSGRGPGFGTPEGPAGPLTPAERGRGIEDIVELRVTGRKALVKDFLVGWNQVQHGAKEILLPEIRYLTNDSWEEISGLGGVTGYPLLHSARYAKGMFYVLTIPDNFSDLYALPSAVLTRIRETVSQGLDVSLDGPAKVSLFLYDNRTLLVESFLDEAAEVKLVANGSIRCMQDGLSGEALESEPVIDWRGQDTGNKSYRLNVPAHSYRLVTWEE